MTSHTTSNNANPVRMEGSFGIRVPLELSYVATLSGGLVSVIT
jgi:hypothetical protein